MGALGPPRRGDDLIDAGGIQAAGDPAAGSSRPRSLSLDSDGLRNPLLRHWLVDADTIELSEVQLDQGYPDHGEGWLSLQRLQLC